LVPGGPGRSESLHLLSNLVRSSRHGATVALIHVASGIAAEAVDHAFRSGVLAEPGPLSDIPEDVVREALDLLSPFEPPGLGTHDELEIIGRIDQAYLALRQLLHSMEGGLLR
jgi:hypothetical protein